MLFPTFSALVSRISVRKLWQYNSRFSVFRVFKIENSVQNPLADRTRKLQKRTCVLLKVIFVCSSWTISQSLKCFRKIRQDKTFRRRFFEFCLDGFSQNISGTEKSLINWSRLLAYRSVSRFDSKGEHLILTVWKFSSPTIFRSMFSVYNLSKNDPKHM